jgi:hypothetical protein
VTRQRRGSQSVSNYHEYFRYRYGVRLCLQHDSSVRQGNKHNNRRISCKKINVKALPVTDRRGSHIFLDNRLIDGGEVVSLMLRQPFTLRKIPGNDFWIWSDEEQFNCTMQQQTLKRRTVSFQLDYDFLFRSGSLPASYTTSTDVEWAKVPMTTHLHPVSRLRMVKPLLPLPIRFHDVVCI